MGVIVDGKFGGPSYTANSSPLRVAASSLLPPRIVSLSTLWIIGVTAAVVVCFSLITCCGRKKKGGGGAKSNEF
uniref:Uncharacterized protein n=1 Tax=Romanomermis culicivorax TaxID=13658 RepID=A0A915I622_ROMCU